MAASAASTRGRRGEVLVPLTICAQTGSTRVAFGSACRQVAHQGGGGRASATLLSNAREPPRARACNHLVEWLLARAHPNHFALDRLAAHDHVERVASHLPMQERALTCRRARMPSTSGSAVLATRRCATRRIKRPRAPAQHRPCTPCGRQPLGLPEFSIALMTSAGLGSRIDCRCRNSQCHTRLEGTTSASDDDELDGGIGIALGKPSTMPAAGWHRPSQLTGGFD